MPFTRTPLFTINVLFHVQNAGDGAPANTYVKGGTSLGAVTVGANSGIAVTLTTASAYDLYVVVEDAANNISEPLKIEVAAYVPPTSALAFELISGGDNDGTYRVTKGTYTTGAVVIPSTYNGVAVTEIGAAGDTSATSAFAGTTITSITIPASVKVIGYGAFSSVTSLTTVTFAAGSTLTTIGASAFSGCTGITSLTIPASVTSVGSNAVRSWTNSQTVTVPFANAGAMPNGWNSLWNYQSSATITYTSPPTPSRGPTWAELKGNTFYKDGATITFSGDAPASGQINHSNGTRWSTTYLSGTTMTLEGNTIQLTITTTDGTAITFAGGTGTSAQVLQGTWGGPQ